MNGVRRSATISDNSTPSTNPENEHDAETTIHKAEPKIKNMLTTRSGKLDLCDIKMETVGVHDRHTLKREEMGIGSEDGSDGHRKCASPCFRRMLRNCIRAIGASMPSIIIILACIPWLKFFGHEAFLGLVISATLLLPTEIISHHRLLKDCEYLHHSYVVRVVTYISLVITLYLVQDFHLWQIFVISEGIQITTNITEQYLFLTPKSRGKGVRIFCESIAITLAYRLQLWLLPVLAMGTFYVNLNVAGISNGIQVVVTGILFPVLKSICIYESVAFVDKVLGEKHAHWEGLEIALEASIDYPLKFSIMLNFPFGQSFLTTVILNFISRVTVRLLVVSAVRHSEKSGSGMWHGRLVRYIRPHAMTLKHTVTFAEVGDCISAICAIVSAVVMAQGTEEFHMSLVYKALAILFAESGCHLVSNAEESMNGRLIPEYDLWVGAVPGISVARTFGVYLLTRYTILTK